jgi:hypothetical protein
MADESMNGSIPKPQPVIAEILPGFALLTVLAEAYLYGQHKPFREQVSLLIGSGTGIAALGGAFTLLASWIAGTLLDTIGNGAEELLDRYWHEVNWHCLVDGERERVERINQWFFAYYLLDRNYLFAMVLVCLAGILQWITLPWQLWVVLGVGIPVVAFDALSLREEIRHLMVKCKRGSKDEASS